MAKHKDKKPKIGGDGGFIEGHRDKIPPWGGTE